MPAFSLTEILARAADLVWSYPVVGLCLLSALYFTVRLGFVQLRVLPHALALLTGRYDDPDETGAISHLQALAAALSGTIGIGNIAGVAIAISVGGPGAVLWMWVAGLLGMATKFVECTLGTTYRKVEPDGSVRGGPMYYIVAGLGPRWRPVAWFYAMTIALAGLGFTCMFQSNQAANALSTSFAVPTWVTGLVLAVLTAAVILGGIEAIGRWAARIVPLVCLTYVLGALGIALWHYELLPQVLVLIVRDGLSGEAAAGGTLGAVITWGIRRAVFSNEAGLGSAAIAHAAVKTDEPVREGVVASLGPLIDTIIVSGATAVVIVLAGNYGDARLQPLAGVEPVVQVEGAWTSTLARSEPVAGRPVLRHEGGGAEGIVRVTLPPATEEQFGVRFAYRGGDRRAGVRILGGMAGPEPLAAVELTESSACPPSPTWRLCAIELASPAKQALAEGGVLELRAGDEPLETTTPVPVRELTGISLTSASFDHFVRGFGTIFITIAGFFFALSTMITWSYYGETASEWLLGRRAILPYRIVFIGTVFLGAIYRLGLVISLSDLLVGLLVVPNVVAIVALSPRVVRDTRDYLRRLKAGQFDR
ncbi:MAG: sodium:alanine symporter family protein [Myxococcota bacterium]